MSSLGTPIVKRRHINVNGISPPLKRFNNGIHKTRSSITVRAKRHSTDQGGPVFAQKVLNQLEKLSTLEQKALILDNATVGDFMVFKPFLKAIKNNMVPRTLPS